MAESTIVPLTEHQLAFLGQLQQQIDGLKGQQNAAVTAIANGVMAVAPGTAMRVQGSQLVIEVPDSPPEA
jgi:hypothetical protein